MIRLHFVVEGQTEETFVRDVLEPVLAKESVVSDVHKITTGRKKGVVYRGGFVAYTHLRRDLSLWMKQHQNSDARFTTMIDLYRLPRDFPGIDQYRTGRDPFERVKILETEFERDFNDHRLIPYIQLHEFEALLFSDPDAFSSAFPESHFAIAELKRIRKAFASPEHINEGPETAPSKQICKNLPDYAKTSYGMLIAESIGLGTMRSECAHFDAWIGTLLRLSVG